MTTLTISRINGFFARGAVTLVLKFSRMKTFRNITRFTYENTSFQGWRVTLCRNQRHFTRYFSDKVYGGEEAALQAALRARASVLARLAEQPDNPSAVFSFCRKEVDAQQDSARALPAGMNPKRRYH